MLKKWILWAVLVSAATAGFAAYAQVADTSELLKTADELVQAVTKLRGLEPRSPIQKGVKSREEIAQYLKERVQQDYDPGELEAEGKMLKRLGLIPAGLDYREFVLRLLSEQVGGYYDPEKDTLFIASWLSVEEQKPVLVHELTHALQDQYFDIGKMHKEGQKYRDDDRALARQALLEGDAMAVMLQYLLEPLQRHFSQLPDLAFIMRAQMSSMQSQYAVFKDAPAFLQESLLFSYGYGAAFLQKVWAADPSWQAVNRIYSDMPASTEQIMHPEKYLNSRDNPKTVPGIVPAEEIGAGWKTTYENTLGEFSLGLLLSLRLSEERSRRAAAGWGGDKAALLENGEGKDAVFIRTVWDTPEDAEQFFLAMQDWLQKGYPKADRTDESPSGFSLLYGGECHSIRREGSDVRLVIGLPESDAQNLRRLWHKQPESRMPAPAKAGL